MLLLGECIFLWKGMLMQVFLEMKLNVFDMCLLYQWGENEIMEYYMIRLIQVRFFTTYGFSLKFSLGTTT
jgi:hypothetical protein